MVIFLLSDPSYPFLGFVRCPSIIVQIRLFHQYLSLPSDYTTVEKGDGNIRYDEKVHWYVGYVHLRNADP